MKIDKSKIMIGSDIEVFLLEPISKKFVSAIGLIGGTKDDPRPLARGGCCVQEDNVTLEYNVPPVSLSGAEEMWDNIQYVINTVKNDTLPKDLEVVCCSSAVFDADQLDNEKAQEFGCDPDFNAWENGLPNEKPRAGINLRSCGAHIHVSFEGANAETSMDLVRVFDLFLGVPSVFIDTDTNRRLLYGKAGAYRPKQFTETIGGFEYRVLSNWWTSDLVYVKWIFSQIEKAIDFYNNNEKGVYIYEKEIITSINESNTAVAEVLCTEFNIEIPEKIYEKTN